MKLKEKGVRIAPKILSPPPKSKQLTEEKEEYLRKFIVRLEDGALPKKTLQLALNALQKRRIEEIKNSIKVIGILQGEVSRIFLNSHYVDTFTVATEKRGG